MTLQRTRRPRGVARKGTGKPANIPEYLEAQEVNALLSATPHMTARLLMLIQWRAGLRVSEALAIEGRDLSLESERPTLRVRHGKGSKARIVPVHPELKTGLIARMGYGEVHHGDRIVKATRSTADRWIRAAAAKAVELGAIQPGRRISSHTLRHSYARHLLLNGIPINYLSRWLGHSSIQTTLIYLELVPDPAGMLAGIP